MGLRQKRKRRESGVRAAGVESTVHLHTRGRASNLGGDSTVGMKWIGREGVEISGPIGRGGDLRHTQTQKSRRGQGEANQTRGGGEKD